MLKQFRATVPFFSEMVYRRRALLPETVSTYDRLLVSVTLEKREGDCALFVQKTPDMLTNLPSARKTLLDNLPVLKKKKRKKKEKNMVWIRKEFGKKGKQVSTFGGFYGEDQSEEYRYRRVSHALVTLCDA